MQNTTVVIITHNGLEQLKVCFKSLCIFNSLEKIRVIIADNASTDGTKEWAESNELIKYINLGKEMLGYGKILNKVFEQGNTIGNVLFLTPHYSFTPNCIDKLNKTLAVERVGIASPVSNGFYYMQQPKQEVNTFKEAIGFAEKQTELLLEERVHVYPEAIMIKEECFNTVGVFSDDIIQIEETIIDYTLKIICNDYTIQCCHGAILFDVDADKGRMELQQYSTLNGADFDRDILKKKWGMKYFNGDCNDRLVDAIKSKAEEEVSILEVGCDCGANLLKIKQNFSNGHLYGMEINEKAAEIANHLIKNVMVGNIEDENLPYSNHTFDYILFGDVLEHLHNPEKVLNNCKHLLKSDGKIIAIIPNVMHISVIQDLLNGSFTYQDTGLLDSTHIHMFTYNEILRMFDQVGYTTEETMTYILKITEEQEELIDNIMQLNIKAERFMFETYQYTISAKVKSETH